MLFLQIFFLTPFILIIFLISPIIKIRIGRIKSNRIGHSTLPMEIYINEKKLGLHPKNEVVLWYSKPGKIINKFIYKSLLKELIILPSIFLQPLQIFFSKFKQTEKFVYYKVIKSLKDNQKVILYDKMVDEYDIFNKTKSYIKFTNKEIEYGDEFLKKNFIEGNDKFVCFASRNQNYYNEKINSARNGDIKVQIPGVNYLLDNGYKAVRMGRKESAKIESNNRRIFDYSFCNEIEDFLDVYIVSKCKFFISTQHGLNEIATSMRVPKLIVNYWFWDDLIANHLCPIILPKKIFSVTKNKTLSYSEIFKSNINSNPTIESLGKNYKLIDNNENEIYNSIKEMYNLIEKKDLDLDFHFNNQIKFWNNFKNIYVFFPKKTIISPAFFEENKELF